MNGSPIKQFFQTHYPLEKAYDWDNVGIQIGSLNRAITGIMIALDVRKAVVEEALKLQCNYLVVHHPLIFKPLKNILTDATRGQLIETIIKNDLNIYVAHTNYDVGLSGMNGTLADKLELENLRVLELFEDQTGIGRVGTWSQAVPLEEAIQTIKARLEIPQARLILHPKHKDKKIQTLAVSGGSGASHMFAAKQAGADLYLTGDISYHQALDMLDMGLSALDIGHFTEHHFKKALKAELEAYGIEAPIHCATTEHDPFDFV